MKVLLIHASAGAGHLKAAEAIYEYLKAHTDHDVQFVDALDYSSVVFKKTYAGIYTFLISRIPAAWGFFFWLADIRALQPLIRVLRRAQNFLNTQPLHKFLIKENFDYIISTHFMPNEVANALKEKDKIQSRIFCCVTDYDVHRIWLMPKVNHYFVASDWTLGKIVKLGVSSQKATVTGIPVHEKFTQSFDIPALKDKIGIKRDTFTVLVATGSFGIGPIEAMIEKLSGFQIMVICGHNKKLFQRLTKSDYPLVHAFGFVDNVQELMAISDAIVTKAGGLSITESMVQQLPLIFFNAIPGQELNNIRILAEYGVGISGLDMDGIVAELDKMKSSRDYHRTIVKRTNALARPDAVKTIASFIQ